MLSEVGEVGDADIKTRFPSVIFTNDRTNIFASTIYSLTLAQGRHIKNDEI